MSYQPMEQTTLYSRANVLGDKVYMIVRGWDYLAQNTVGTQLIRSTDSVAANLVEGDSRGSNQDTLRFYYYSRSSAREARHWLRRAAARKLLPDELAEELVIELTEIAKIINSFIRFRKTSKRTVREPMTAYGEEDPFTSPLEDLAEPWASSNNA